MTDKQIRQLIISESKRQNETLPLIPSENYASSNVRQAVGSILMNKYAEGQAGKRYYQGNEFIDEVENLCKKRALKLFSLDEEKWGVNVQSLSGSPANQAVINALLEPGDTIMAMNLPDGGHLSHGWHVENKKVTLVSKVWNVVFYFVDPESQVFDYEKLAQQARQTKPKLIISGGTAYPREINHRKMGQIARSVRAYYLADIAHEAGLVASGVNKSPFTHADAVTMTTHKILRGPRGAIIFGRNKYIEEIDKSVFPGLQGGPHMHSIAGIAVCLDEAKSAKFKKYSQQVIKNAREFADLFMKEGVSVVSGGTDKHLVLLDLRNLEISAWITAWALEYAGIIVNRNTVPGETGSSYYPSGIRLGTPAITTRGMKETQIKQIVKWMLEIFEMVKPYQIPSDKGKKIVYTKLVKKDLQENERIIEINKEVKKMCMKFPVS